MREKTETRALVVRESNAKHLELAQTLFDGLDSNHTRRAYINSSRNSSSTPRERSAGEQSRARPLQATSTRRSDGDSAINQRLSAIRRGLREMADRQMLDPLTVELACKVKGVAQRGERTGNWLTLEEAQKLINAPDTSTALGLRDRAILALLVGSGLRRAECAALTVEHLQQREGRWAIIDLVGKRNKKRSVPIAGWVKDLVDALDRKSRDRDRDDLPTMFLGRRVPGVRRAAIHPRDLPCSPAIRPRDRQTTRAARPATNLCQARPNERRRHRTDSILARSRQR